MVQDPFDALPWDTEDRNGFSRHKGHARDNIMYIPAGLWNALNKHFGGIVAYVRTATEVETGKVIVAKADASTEGAVEVKLVGALNSAEFNIWRNLKKLNLTIPPNRQLNVPARLDTIGSRPVLIFDFDQRISVPRNRKEEAAVKSATENQEDKKPGDNQQQESAPTGGSGSTGSETANPTC